jgi:hypothetical protein
MLNIIDHLALDTPIKVGDQMCLMKGFHIRVHDHRSGPRWFEFTLNLEPMRSEMGLGLREPETNPSV